MNFISFKIKFKAIIKFKKFERHNYGRGARIVTGHNVLIYYYYRVAQ